MNIDIQVDGEKIIIIRGGGFPSIVKRVDDLISLLPEFDGYNPLSIVSYGNTDTEYILYPVKILDENMEIYGDIVAIEYGEYEIVKGDKLIELLSNAISKPLGIEYNSEIRIKDEVYVKSLITSEVKNLTNKLVDEWNRYRREVLRMSLRSRDIMWREPRKYHIEIGDPILKIHFVKTPTKESIKIDEELKDQIEKKAYEIAMEIEKQEGRHPEFVGNSEHYDIRSLESDEGEYRYIEVKGHAGPEIYAELSYKESEFARKHRNNYWIYIVYNILKGKPVVLRFKDPVKTMVWKEIKIEKVETKFILYPKEEKDE